MVRVKMLMGNKFCIIEDSDVYVFSKNGSFESKDSVGAKYMDGMLDLPVLSVVTCRGTMEVAAISSGVLRTFRLRQPALMLCMSLMYKGSLVCYGRRNGFEVGNGQKADQFVLVYKEGTDVISHLSGLDCEEVPVDA